MLLLRTELRRLQWRRLVWLLCGLGICGLLILLGGISSYVQPVTDQERAEAEALYQEELAIFEEEGEQLIAECLADEELSAESGQREDYDCDELEPQRDWYLPDEIMFDETVRDFSVGLGFTILIAVGLGIGTTAVAAEFSSGTMSTLPTFEPRRLRVYSAKVGSAVLAAIPISLLLCAIIGAGTWLAFQLSGLETPIDGNLIWTGVRALAILPGAALVGAVLAFLLRSTAIVLSIVACYAVIWEEIGLATWPSWMPYSIKANVLGWVNHGQSYFVDLCTSQEDGEMVCEFTERTISFAWSAGFLAIVCVLLVLLGALVFRRRDVS